MLRMCCICSECVYYGSLTLRRVKAARPRFVSETTSPRFQPMWPLPVQSCKLLCPWAPLKGPLHIIPKYLRRSQRKLPSGLLNACRGAIAWGAGFIDSKDRTSFAFQQRRCAHAEESRSEAKRDSRLVAEFLRRSENQIRRRSGVRN